MDRELKAAAALAADPAHLSATAITPRSEVGPHLDPTAASDWEPIAARLPGE